MLARDVMQQPEVVRADSDVKSALETMRSKGHRFLPVVDADGRVVGLFSALSVVSKMVPDYIVSGDLDDIPYAPDFGLLRQHYDVVKTLAVSQLMIDKPLVIKQDDSLLSVAAALVTHPAYDAVLAVDAEARLVGIITSSDVLNRLRSMPAEAAHAD